MMNNDERVISLLEDILTWQRLAARKEFAPFLQQTLADAKEYKAFELTDGTRSQQQVADAAGLSQATMSRLWGKWRRLGIVRDKNGKMAHVISASDYGVPAPAGVSPDGDGVPQRRTRRRAVVPAATVEAPATAVDGVQAQ